MAPSIPVPATDALFYRTPAAWASQVLENPVDLLSDHAWLEKKAANNALDLLNQWPRAELSARWMAVMSAVARDEVQHLGLVCRQLSRLGGGLERRHGNPYATELHERVRRGQGPHHLLDRLLVAALIEARSCERFELLAGACDDGPLQKLYAGLVASEAGHYRIFLDLAAHTHASWSARWDELRTVEAEIIARQPPGPRMHSGTG